MNTLSSPALSQIEVALNISADVFAKNQYHSVFDIVRQSRQQFIAANMSWLGTRGGKAYDLAMGQAQHVRRLFSKNKLTSQIQRSLPRTLSGEPVRGVSSGSQGLAQNGPSWQNQFGNNWQAYCQSGSPEAYDSPVSYLTWLYNQAQTFESDMTGNGGDIIPLSERRPDLASMVIDNDAVNQVVPALQLVNEILEESLATAIPANSTVDETLATTRYPTLLPYHFPHDQVMLSLENAQVPIENIIDQTSTDWPWFLNNNLTGALSQQALELAGKLSPEAMTIVTEPDNTTNDDVSGFYSKNLGLAATDYTPFEDIDTFTHQLGITVPETEKLIAGSAGGTAVTQSPNMLNGKTGIPFISEDLTAYSSQEPGIFGNALSLYNLKGSYGWFNTDGITATTMKGDKPFSISMWIYVSAHPTDGEMPIITNSKVRGQGIALTVNNGNFLLVVQDSSGSRSNDTNTAGNKATVNQKWYHICLTWDSSTRIANFYYQGADSASGSTIKVDASALTGKITTPQGMTWALNDSGDFSYYTTSHPETLVNFLYDDIGVFAGVLTEADATLLATAKAPLSQVPGLSLEPIAYYPLDSSDAPDSKDYGASFINSTQNREYNFHDATQEVTVAAGSAGYIPERVPAIFGEGYKLYATQKNSIRLDSETNNLLSGNSDFSIGFWLNLSAFAPSDQGRVPVLTNCFPQNGEQGFSVEINTSGILVCTINNSAGYHNCSSSALTVNTWYYVTLVWNATTRIFTINTIAKNGTEVSATSTSALNAGTFPDDATKVWTFNESGNTANPWFKSDTADPSSMIVDDIGIWLNVITTDDILAIASSPNSLWKTYEKCSVAPDFYYSMDNTPKPLNSNEPITIGVEEEDIVIDPFLSDKVTQSDSNAIKHPETSHNFMYKGHSDRGITVYTEDGSHFYFDNASDPYNLMKGDKSFTLGFWLYRTNQVKNRVPIFSNSGDAEQSAPVDPGFSLTLNTGSAQTVYLLISDGNTYVKSDWVSTLPFSTWCYVALVWDATSKKADLYLLPAGTTTAVANITLSASTLKTITPKDNFHWVFNARGDFSNHNAFSEDIQSLIYDDISVFAGCLTTADITKIVTATKPLSVINPDLSIPYSHYYSLTSANNVYKDDISGEYATSGSGSAEYNPTVVLGKIGYGLKLFGTQNNYLQLGTEANNTLSGAKDFTLGFWFKPLSLPKTGWNAYSDIPLLTNCTLDQGKTGFTLSIHNPDTLHATADDSTGKYCTCELVEPLRLNEWCYVTLAWTANSQTLTLSMSDSIDNIVSDSKQITGSSGVMTPAAGTAWTFNESGDLTFYATDPASPFSFIIDDISVWDKVLSADEIQHIALSLKASGGRRDAVHHYSFDAPLEKLFNLSDARMDRINRMVRLQRWLELSYEETDLLLSACIGAQGSQNTDDTLNDHTLRALGVFRHWQHKYGVTAFQFAAVLYQITPYALSPAIPFLDQIFNSPSLFNEPFAITGQAVKYTDTTGDSARVVRQLCAGLGITQAQFQVLAARVAEAQGSVGDKTFPLTLDTVSAFYRLVMVPRWLGLSFAEGSSLFSLLGKDSVWSLFAGVPQLAFDNASKPTSGDILDALMALENAAEWAKNHGLSWVKNYLTLQPAPEQMVASTSTVNLVNNIKQQLPATLLNEQSFETIRAPVPAPTMLAFPNSYSSAAGAVTDSVAEQLDSKKGQYASFVEEANTLTNSSTSFSLGMWAYIGGGASIDVPLLANAIIHGDKTTGPGIALTLGSSYNLNVRVTDDKASTPITSTTGANWGADSTWFYLALVVDAGSKTLTVYAVTKSGGSVTKSVLDYSTLVGSIVPPQGNTWTMNEDGSQQYYETFPGSSATIIIDDAAIWSSVLTEAQIKEIAKSGAPASQYELAPVPVSIQWPEIVNDLIDNDGLVLPTATNYDTILSLVQDDISTVTFDSSVDKDQVAHAIATLIYQAKLTQNGIADSALAQLFSTQQSLSAFLLRWAGDSEYRLLSDSLTMNNQLDITDPTTIPEDYLDALYLLGQRAGIVSEFQLTPATLSTFLTHPIWLGVDETTPPLPLTLTLLHRFSCYRDCLRAATKEDAVLAYLGWVNAATPPSASEAAEALAALLDWESDEVTLATAGLTDGIAKTVYQVDYVMRLQDLCAETGLSVTPLLDTGKLKTGTTSDTWASWQSAGESLVAAQTNQ